MKKCDKIFITIHKFQFINVTSLSPVLLLATLSVKMNLCNSGNINPNRREIPKLATKA